MYIIYYIDNINFGKLEILDASLSLDSLDIIKTTCKYFKDNISYVRDISNTDELKYTNIYLDGNFMIKQMDDTYKIYSKTISIGYLYSGVNISLIGIVGIKKITVKEEMSLIDNNQWIFVEQLTEILDKREKKHENIFLPSELK